MTPRKGWQEYARAARKSVASGVPARPDKGSPFRTLAAVRPKIWHVEKQGASRRQARADVRLVPCAVAAWCTAFFAAAASSVLLCWLAGGLGACGAIVLGIVLLRRRESAARSGLMLMALSLIICAAVCGVCLLDAQRNEAQALAIPDGARVKGIAVVLSNPREGAQSIGSGKSWLVDAELVTIEPAGGGQLTPVKVLVTVSGARPSFAEGARLEVTGKVKHGPTPGDPYFLALSSSPITLRSAEASRNFMVQLRAGLSDSAHHLPGDESGLVPAMVAGDRSGVDPGLDAAMKRVGLTHLTAVSGANCTIILTAVILLARSLRAPRWAVSGIAIGGLGLFVLLVGPDASVLRAAVMGGIGVMASLGGRPRRLGAMLSGAVVVLILLAPAMAVSFAFVLSTLATVGLIILGQPFSRWLSRFLPAWLATLLAIPMAAQLVCAPVIVLLSPQLAVYAVPANVAATPVVALVTVIGTLIIPTAQVCPALARLLADMAGVGAQWVAGVARWFAGLPGAAIPWPDGIGGMLLMAVFSALCTLALWAGLHRAELGAARRVLLSHTPAALAPALKFPGALFCLGLAAGVATWCLRAVGSF